MGYPSDARPFDTADRLESVAIVDHLRAPVDETPAAPPVPELPEFVYVPTASVVRLGRDDDVVVELRPMTGGLVGMLVYTSLDSLAECCGLGQPWAKVPSERLEYLHLATGADVIAYDLPLPLELTRAGGDA
jgi:hypothetical protein